MENNIIQILSSYLNKNQTSNQNSNFSQSKQNSTPLYPMEAYPDSNTIQGQSINNNEQNLNNLLPLLLSLMGQSSGSSGIDLISSLLSSPNSSQEKSLNGLAKLLSSINKKNNDKEKDKNEDPIINEGKLPKNQIL